MLGVCILSLLLAIVSTSIMAYIAMATPIGPWIAPTLVLLSSLLYRLVPRSMVNNSSVSIAYATIGGSIGGILATACGFSFPTLYFLDPDLFESWISYPWYFVTILTVLSATAGGLGWLLADIWDERLLVQEAMPFPIGQMIYKMIDVQHKLQKAWQLLYGFVSTVLFCQLQKGFFGYLQLIPSSYRVCSVYQLSCLSFPRIILRFDQFPMLWAIGFITGHVIAIPLAVGALAKIFLVEPVNVLCFEHISQNDFMMAFCSGMVVCGTLVSFLSLPKLFKSFKSAFGSVYANSKSMYAVSLHQVVMGIAIAFGTVSFLTYFKFSLASQLFLVIGTIITTYQIVTIAGKIGLAPLGRFATFIMVPSMLLFGLNATQVTIVATFVEMCGGVATDVLFGRKVARMKKLSYGKVRFVQLLGLLASSVALGIVMLILVKHFKLGSPELCAQRSQTRALLINFKSFDYYAVVLGALFSYLLKYISINPVLVLGGLLMSFDYSLVLILGGLSTYLYKEPQEQEPFWSGVFAANSIWILVQALL